MATTNRSDKPVGEDDLGVDVVVRIDVCIDARVDGARAKPPDRVGILPDDVDLDAGGRGTDSGDQREGQCGDDGIIGADHEPPLDPRRIRYFPDEPLSERSRLLLEDILSNEGT